MKKRVLFVVSIALFCPLFHDIIVQTTASANSEVKHIEENRFTLYSPDFSRQYTCVEPTSGGYYIVDNENECILEYNPNSSSPYQTMSKGTYIYGGPMNYGVTIIKEKSIESKKKIVLPKISKKANFDFSQLALSDTIDDLIDNASLIANLTDFHRNKDGTGSDYNNNGTCGYLAAAILLYYNKYQYNTNFIADKYIEFTNKNQRRFSLAFYDYFFKNFGGDTSTTAFSIKSTLKKYCESIGINTNHYAMLLSTRANIDLCIRDNKPVLLFGNFTNPYDGKRSNHAVTCYGTRTITSINGEAMRYFIVNYGWSSDNANYSSVLLVDNLFTNPVGSMYNMNY